MKVIHHEGTVDKGLRPVPTAMNMRVIYAC